MTPEASYLPRWVDLLEQGDRQRARRLVEGYPEQTLSHSDLKDKSPLEAAQELAEALHLNLQQSQPGYGDQTRGD